MPTLLDPPATDELPPAPPVAPPPPPRSPDLPRSPRRRSGWRFFAGAVAGSAVTALVGGGILIANGSDDASPPPTTVAAVQPAPEGAAPSSVHDLVVAARPSIAAIHTTITGTDIFGRQMQGEAAGSGFVLSADGYIVTNDHVVDGAENITVALGDGTTEDAELVAADPRSDLAVLHVDRTDLAPLPIGDSDAIQVGDPVVAIGNALDLGAEPTVTGGMISAKGRTITEPNGSVLVDLVQTDAAISPGNSGGPLLDLQGRVVGINTAIAGQGQNIGFAIAINPARDLIDQLRTGEVPRHALLGVSTQAVTGQDAEGALVVAVEAGSAADDAGIRTGDVIVGLDGDAIVSPPDLVAAIARHRPGDEVEITIRRDGDEQQLEVTLGAHDEVSS